MSTKPTATLAMAAFAAGLALGGAATAAEAPAAAALEADAPKAAVTYSVVYTADVTGAVGGAQPHAGRYLDNLDVIADVDLAEAVGWRGAALHAYLLNNSGGAPNDVAGTLQGVDNIEVATPRLRVFEFWLDQSFAQGKASVRAGLYNLNSEFYVNDAASQLMAPAFGIGSELAATGPNGPSIFPATALAVRLNLDLGKGVYARAAVLNAKAGVVGDPRGVDLGFGDGFLTIAEAGISGPAKLSAGVWRYTRTQDDIRDVDAAGRPQQRRAQGVYALAETRVLGKEDGRALTAFLRAGASDGATTPFRGGWQAGLRLSRPFAGRPDGVLSLGVEQGLLGQRFRDNLRDAVIAPARAESGVEVNYSDRLSRRISLQPDVQWIHHPGGDRAQPDRWIAALRVKIILAGGA